MTTGRQRRAEIRKRSCDGKERHTTGPIATGTLLEWTQRRGLNLTDFCVYFCQFCNFWHIGGMLKAVEDLTPGEVKSFRWRPKDPEVRYEQLHLVRRLDGKWRYWYNRKDL